MGVMRELFGPSKKEIWESLSEQIEANYVKGGFFKGTDRVVAKAKEWTITLDTYTVSTGKSSTTYTRMRAAFVNTDQFRFSVYRCGIFSGLGKFLGFEDIEIGDTAFDEDFVIKASDEEKVKLLLADPKIRDLIDEQTAFHLEVKDDDGWFGSDFPQGVDELHFQIGGVLKDITQLKGLFELFSEILNRLCIIGAAYENDPGIQL